MNYSDMHKEALAFFDGQKNTDLSSVVRGEYSALAKALEGKVGSFLQTSGLSAAKYEAGAAMEAMDGIQSAVQRYGVDKIVSWLEDTIKIPAEHLQQATLAVLNVLSRHDKGQTKGALWASQSMNAPQNQGVQYQALESIYADEVAQSMQQGSAGLEAFGVDMNTTPADLKTALVLTLLQYYIGVVPRILPTLPTNQPSVIFTKSRRKVMDLAENPEAKYNFIELMRNPGLLYGELRRIIPQAANANAGEVVSDGWLAPNVDANILKLGIEYEKTAGGVSTGVPKYGHAKINITDTVADNVSVEAIKVSITDGTTTETYTCPVGTTYARLTRTNNSKDAADRQAVFESVFRINKSVTPDGGSAASTLLAGLDDEEGILIRFRVTATINLKTGKAYATIIPSVGPFVQEGVTPSAGMNTLFPISGTPLVSANVVAYKLDARYTEDNFRKTSKLATIDKQQISYELMQGTNYFVQVSLQDKQQEDATVDLGQLIQLEEDAKQIRIIETTINKIDAALKLSGALNPVDDIGSEYIAGDIVFPATYSTTLDVAKLKVLQTGDVTGDVRTRVRTFLGYITTELVRLSLIDKVLTNGAEINFGLITNRRVLDNCLSVAHYHNHLNGGDTQGTNNGVEFRLVLDNGIILNVVTTTFNDFYSSNFVDSNAVVHKSLDKMILFPIMPNSPDSYLNFGQIYDYGAMSGRYSFSDRGSTVERIFANVRRQLIPTNPQGAIIDVLGIEEIMADAVYAKALTSSTSGTVGF